MKALAVALYVLSINLITPNITALAGQTCNDSLCRNVTIMLDGKPHRCVVCGSVAQCS